MSTPRAQDQTARVSRSAGKCFLWALRGVTKLINRTAKRTRDGLKAGRHKIGGLCLFGRALALRGRGGNALCPSRS